MIYDLIIIGAGPSGITSAIYSARKKLNFLVISKDIGGQAAITSDIQNYTGYQFISGAELAQKFEEHIKQYNITHKSEDVKKITKKGETFVVETDKEKYESKTVILSLGAKPKQLNVPGEKEFKNRGVTYCATCDGPLFADKIVAVVGGGNSAMEAAMQMEKIATKVHLITLNDDLVGEAVVIDKIKRSKKIELITKAKTKEIKGDVFVEKLVYEQEGKEKTLDVEGVFIEVGYAANSSIAECEKNKWNEIVINSRCETSIPGMFAAGDCTNIPFKQIIIAAGQGSIAAMSAFEYLIKKK